MRLFVLIFVLTWASFPNRSEAQNATEPEVVQMIGELKAAVPDCAVNIRYLGNA